MRSPDLVLDTNVFNVRGFWSWLARYPGRKSLPIVAFVEAAHYWGRRFGLEKFRDLLLRAGVEVEWLRLAEAERSLQAAARADDFEENARDHLIAGHVREGRTFVTSNVKDFAFLESVVTPEQAMQRFGVS